jgi:hypothetical protein
MPAGPRLDHIVLRTPQRDDVACDLAARTGLPLLDGFSEDAHLRSRGVRFGDGPFFDVFAWPADRAPFSPLIAIADDLARVAAIAEAQGWAYVIHRGEDAPEPVRPHWSTLSFRRGQGIVSSLFAIQYVRVVRAATPYRGFLYDPDYGVREKARFGRVVMGARDVAAAGRALRALGWSGLIDVEHAAQDGFTRAEWLGPRGPEAFVATPP